MKSPIILLAALLLGPGSVAAQSANASGWSITPYLWAPKTSIDLTLRGTDIGSGNISFDELLDTIEAAFMVHVEGGSGQWSAFGDLTYLDTTDTDQREVFTIDTDSTQTYLDAAVAYWPGGVGSAFNIYGGLRYSGFDDEYTFRLGADNTVVGSQASSTAYYDALLGLRYTFELTPRWSLLLRTDASFGDSEGTYLVRANFGYTVGKRQQNTILFGYQYKQAEFRDADLTTDYSFNGPLAGFSFRF